MLALLPNRDAPTFFIDVHALRSSGILNLLRSSGVKEDDDYSRFVYNTGFDYQRDVETIAARGKGQQFFFVVRGKFDWARLRRYASQHGGSCDRAHCQLPGTQPGRWISFLEIQPDMAGVALSTDAADVLLLTPRQVQARQPLSSAPVWVLLPHSSLADPRNWPLPVRLFALAMQPAEQVILSARPGEKGSRDMWLDVQAVFQDASAAARTKTQLEMDTRLLKLELQREHRQESPGDLTGLLTAGVFNLSREQVVGKWPIHRELLNALE